MGEQEGKVGTVSSRAVVKFYLREFELFIGNMNVYVSNIVGGSRYTFYLFSIKCADQHWWLCLSCIIKVIEIARYFECVCGSGGLEEWLYAN